ncbi:unnamed protein product [Oikopleura dioica]|uniref:EF-hand domain-containing protein n=1 Tax=Oikopleura dioica TaxID=34765 RepID=E4XU34_OIKDI|nr:unnamed protein product [Oikopleura dioica]
MKTTLFQWTVALAAILPAMAQQDEPRGERRPHPVPPILAFFDADHDGVLSEKEIQDASKALGRLDHDQDGEITAEEARPPLPPRGPKPPQPPVIAALDADRDGTISAEEMENAPDSLKSLDKNEDGELSPEELHPHGPPPPGPDGKSPQGPPPEERGGESLLEEE